MKNMSEQMNGGLSGGQKGKTISTSGRFPSVLCHAPDLSSFALHVLAMLLMLCDHLWATLLPQYAMLTHIGRIAFPILRSFWRKVQGIRTIQKYLLRLLIFAVLSEIPFDLMYGGTVFYPYHQNVLWTFLIALSGIFLAQSVEKKFRHRWMAVPLWAACILLLCARLPWYDGLLRLWRTDGVPVYPVSGNRMVAEACATCGSVLDQLSGLVR